MKTCEQQSVLGGRGEIALLTPRLVFARGKGELDWRRRTREEGERLCAFHGG